MKHTSDIFAKLSKGQFISANSIDPQVRALYADLEDCQAEYEEYFDRIDFHLSQGDGYYYFSRREQKVITENKLRNLLPWIDHLDFLKSYDATFDAGTQFNTAQMEVRVGSDIELREKLERLFPDKRSIRDKLEALVGAMVAQGYAEVVNEVEGMCQVANAFRYIQDLMDCINIDEEVKDEIPE